MRQNFNAWFLTSRTNLSNDPRYGLLLVGVQVGQGASRLPWRELLQTSAARIGVPGVVAPVFRLVAQRQAKADEVAKK